MAKLAVSTSALQSHVQPYIARQSMETCHPPGNGFFCRVVDTLDAEVAAEDAALAVEAEGVEVAAEPSVPASSAVVPTAGSQPMT